MLAVCGRVHARARACVRALGAGAPCAGHAPVAHWCTVCARVARGAVCAHARHVALCACMWRRATGQPVACSRLHFRRIIHPWTDERLGNCSYLNTCRNFRNCK